MLSGGGKINMVHPNAEIGNHLAVAIRASDDHISVHLISHSDRDRVMGLHGGDHLVFGKRAVLWVNRHIKSVVKSVFSGFWPPP